MRKTDLAWAAGIVDGEGYIGMAKNNPGTNRRKTLSFQVRISVRMTHKPTIEKLHNLFGGTFKSTSNTNPTKHKPTYEWYVGDVKTVEVLSYLLPYLVTKQEQAKLILDFRKSCFNWKQDGVIKICPNNLCELRLSYFDKLHALNRKGPQ